jgi:NAD(P)-dependent dehydrogenase (short-subunit alcohol dehydrogenase family)
MTSTSSNHKRELEGKVAIVTGASSGIGYSVALRLAKEGASVVAAARRVDKLNGLVTQIEKAGDRAFAVEFDATKEADHKRLVEETVKKYGRLDIAFNNAGVIEAGPVTGITEEQISRVFDTNCKGVLLGMKHQIPALISSGTNGVIINNSSFLSTRHVAGLSLYSASKSFVDTASRIAAIENRGKVRMNVVAPGFIESEIMKDKETAKKSTLVQRHGVGEDAAEWIVQLASDKASFITGVILPIDGGANIFMPAILPQ